MSEFNIAIPGARADLPLNVIQAISNQRRQLADPMAAFFYDLNALSGHARQLKAELPEGVELYYAIKANSEAPILETLAPIVDGFELSSGGEIARACGCSQPRPWVLSGPGKLDSDMRQAIANGIEAFHVESVGEIARLQNIARDMGQPQSVLLRINPSLPEAAGSRLQMAGAPTPFGIDEADLAEAVQAVDNASHLKLVGFHVHAMSHQQDVERHQQLIAWYLARWPEWQALAKDPEALVQLNVGGGIGVNYLIDQPGGEQQFDWPALCRSLESQLNAMHNPPRLRFEIGRFLTAFCGYYVIEVLDRKFSHGEGFLVCRGGTHQFRLPAAQSHDHPVIHLPQPGTVDGESGSWSVVGQLCTPKDVLSRHRHLQNVAVGDLLVLPLAGAYGYNISHADFLCHPRPAQHFITEHLISDHETSMPQLSLADSTTQDPADPRETSIAVPFTAEAQWRHYPRVQQRVMGQLLQTLLYEQVLSYREASPFPRGGERESRSGGENANRRFLIELGANLYQIDGWQCDSFELIRLDYASICLLSADGDEQSPSFQQLVADLRAQFGQGEGGGSGAMQSGFINELEQTLIKDAQSAAYQQVGLEHPQQLDADALEHYFTDAHSYHPCYKSRLGFSLQDNQRYGPEFALPIRLMWLAVPKRLAHCSSVDRIATREFVDAEAGGEVLARLERWLESRQLTRDDVVLIPVHPWQWNHIAVSVLYPELSRGEVHCLGQGEAIYSAQQSIRTLAPRDRQRPYVKLALSITNTSSTRILARHTVTNGPIITQWLQQLIETDDTARGLGFAILGEVAGAAVDERAFDASRYAGVYGTLGAIWRENVSQYLRPGEQAVPLNGLSQHQRHADGSQTPFIQPWIERFGLKAWTRQLLQVSVLPIIHMLYAEGLGMESHGQNIVVIHRDGWPLRIALKDFHDGVRYSPEHLARPELAPELEPVPASHAALNRNSFIITDDVEAVRDFSCDAFFFIALAEMAIFLRRHFALEEHDFWAMAADVVIAYQQSHPQHRERFELFDVFAPTYAVEALTKRRMFGDAELQARLVPNPMAPFRPQQGERQHEPAEALC
ncbi:hypothetical protein MRB56_05360 [Halomonas cupida]|uniref:IucA/IucC family protein n=1 Tax=Halomonas cupida TaxID=44933 RepID=UPI0039B5130A